jgi:transcriptional regulator with XRE-family HTH domain
MPRGPAKKAFHFGEWLKDRVTLKMSIKAFAARLEADESTVFLWFNSVAPNPRRHTLAKIAETLGMELDELEYFLDLARRGVPFEDVRKDFEAGIRAGAQIVGRLAREPNKGPRSPIVAAGDVMPPAYNLGIAAGEWADLEGEGTTTTHAQRTQGWVIVRVDGDSMQPKYWAGQFVMFQIIDPADDVPQVDGDYFIIRNDGRGTFKRLIAIEADEVFVLAALNRKYARRLRASRQEVVMIAVARWIVTDPPPDQ